MNDTAVQNLPFYRRPLTRYWEESFCPFCNSIQCFNRNKEWQMICQGCMDRANLKSEINFKEHSEIYSYPDPLQCHVLGGTKKRLIEKECAKAFLNFEAVELFERDGGACYRILFKDFNAQIDTQEWKAIYRYASIAIKNGIKVFLSKLTQCNNYGQFQQELNWEWENTAMTNANKTFFLMQFEKEIKMSLEI